MSGPRHLVLTARNKQVLRCIVDFHASHPYPAIVSDITKGLELPREIVVYSLHKLVRMGYIDWIVEGRRTRAILPLHAA